MNILAGLYRPDAGEILLDGRPVAFGSPGDSIAAGLGMVHQHFTLVPSQTVTENVLLGLAEPRFWLRPKRSEAIIGELAARYGLRVDPAAKIWQLSVGEQQRVEILKLLYRGARILIMDEPTAVLAPQEIDDLFRTLRSMTADGRSVVFISHKLGEVMAIADRITVMRRGVVTAAALDAGRHLDDGPGPADGRPRRARDHRARAAGAGRGGAGRPRRDRRQRPRPARPARAVARGAGGRGRRHRGRGGQRPGRAGAGHHRPASVPRQRPDRRRGGCQSPGRPRDQAGRRPRARGPDRGRQLAQPVRRRQPHHEALPAAAARPRLVPRRHRGARPGPGPQGRIPDRRAVDRHGGPVPVGRQPAAAHLRPRDRLEAPPDGGRPADARARRRRDRGGPSGPARAAGGGRRDRADLRGARRDPVPVRPGRRHVRGPDRRLLPVGDGRHPRDRPVDDRRPTRSRRRGASDRARAHPP